jgi:hypothetical protein
MTSADFDLCLGDEHRDVRETVRDLCDAQVARYAVAVDEEARFWQETADALVAADVHAPHVPEEYGGADALTTVLVIVDVRRACVSCGLIAAVNKLGSLPVQTACSEERKQNYLGALGSGEGGFSYCRFEPGGGSDAGAIKTRAVRRRRLGDRRCEALDHQRGGVQFYTVMAVGEAEKEKPGRDLGVRGGKDGGRGVLPGPGQEARHQGQPDPPGPSRQGCDPPDRMIGARVTIAAQAVGVAQGALGHGRSATPRNGSSSGSRSPTSRACSSCWPTWS